MKEMDRSKGFANKEEPFHAPENAGGAAAPSDPEHRVTPKPIGIPSMLKSENSGFPRSISALDQMFAAYRETDPSP
jgi:hypothetical protein